MSDHKAKKLAKQFKRRALKDAGNRPCGECQACCISAGVPEIGKPYNCGCNHQCSTGCAIYDARPASCKMFNCLWKITASLPAHCRPDQCGLVLDADKVVSHDSEELVLEIYEIRPGALESTPPEIIQYIKDSLSRIENPYLLIYRYGTNQPHSYSISADYPQDKNQKVFRFSADGKIFAGVNNPDGKTEAFGVIRRFLSSFMLTEKVNLMMVEKPS